MYEENMKGKPCPYSSITCQERFCSNCGIHLSYNEQYFSAYCNAIDRSNSVTEFIPKCIVDTFKDYI